MVILYSKTVLNVRFKDFWFTNLSDFGAGLFIMEPEPLKEIYKKKRGLEPRASEKRYRLPYTATKLQCYPSLEAKVYQGSVRHLFYMYCKKKLT